MKKFISITLVAVMVMLVAVVMAGCGNDEFPVKIANITIDKEPENVVVLDASTADIVAYIGYDKKWAGRSDEVDQSWLDIVPSVGTASDPDVEKIKSLNADIVFSSDSLNDAAKAELESNNIKVIEISQAKTMAQLETNYKTIGKILGGKISGLNMGESAYKKLISEMESINKQASAAKTSDVPNIVCYIYVQENNINMVTSRTYGDELLKYTGAVNVGMSITNSLVDVNTFKTAKPDFIFYSDENTCKVIKENSVLSKLDAVKNNKMLMITEAEMNRQGQTAIETLQKMVYFMYPSLAKNDNAATDDQPATTAPINTQSATQAATQPASTAASSSVASQYNITITNRLSLKPEDENNNVKAMQQRLYDLGYIDDEENITGYFGEISEQAVKDFQKNNSLSETGTADNATLVLMFDSNAKKAS